MINYPHKKTAVSQLTSQASARKKEVDFGRRGMSFEDQIEKTNAHYLARGKAVIHKKPTPIQIVKVDYPKRSAAAITEAYFKTPSTTDFNGVYNGIYIDFEAKETSNKTRFPLANIHEHQAKHIAAVAKQGGCAFLLIKLSTLSEVYVLMSDTLAMFWQQYKEGKRKSISRDELLEYGFPVPEGAYPSVDYLKVIDDIIIKKALK